ncbi:MAG: twin-arginine translocase TatA/TatE family subunit [Prevotellaceae bacterium]|jgi:sec-independent protein translocase protein TatA|nr:twin-arginine translocase TatA/TatE family subunit [Prevotellaceae bacterium]
MNIKPVLCLFSSIGAPEIIIIALVVLLFFGGKKIPELMRGLGKGVRSFKEGVKDMESEVKKNISSDETVLRGE